MGKTHLMQKRLTFCLVILSFYFILHKIPLNGLDMTYYNNLTMDLGTLLSTTVSGSNQQYTVMALGISPYITSSFLVFILMAFRSKESKSHSSPLLMNKIIVVLTFLITLFEAINLSFDLHYLDANLMSQVVCVFELMAGACLCQYMLLLNKKYGIGNMLPIIFINVLESLCFSFKGVSFKSLMVPLIIGLLAAMFMIYLELSEKRIFVQRVSVHNDYAEKDYLAIKYNPVGFMSIMFGSLIFMIPRLIVQFLLIFNKSNSTLKWLLDNLNMQKPFGAITYIVMLFFLTIGLSILFVNPSEISENLLQSGDSIIDLPAGKKTRRYLRRWVLLLSGFSATIICGFLGISLYLQYQGLVEAKLAMLPSTMMMTTGLFISLVLELKAYHDFDSYQRFI